jgi:hypothetical protein
VVGWIMQEKAAIKGTLLLLLLTQKFKHQSKKHCFKLTELSFDLGLGRLSKKIKLTQYNPDKN